MNAIDEAKALLAKCLHIPLEAIDEHGAISSAAELDSINFEQIVLEIEKCLGHTVDPLKLLEMRSVKDLAALLENKA